MQSGNTDAQYNSARVLRHIAMGGTQASKAASVLALPALLRGLKVCDSEGFP